MSRCSNVPPRAASGKEIPYEIVARRPGDVAEVYADASKAKRELGWTSTRGLTAVLEIFFSD